MLGYYNKLSSEIYDIDKYIGLSFGDKEKLEVFQLTDRKDKLIRETPLLNYSI